MFTDLERKVLSKYWVWQNIMRADSQRDKYNDLSTMLDKIITELPPEQKESFVFFEFKKQKMALYVPLREVFKISKCTEEILRSLDAGECPANILSSVNDIEQIKKAKEVISCYTDLKKRAKRQMA